MKFRFKDVFRFVLSAGACCLISNPVMANSYDVTLECGDTMYLGPNCNGMVICDGGPIVGGVGISFPADGDIYELEYVFLYDFPDDGEELICAGMDIVNAAEAQTYVHACANFGLDPLVEGDLAVIIALDATGCDSVEE